MKVNKTNLKIIINKNFDFNKNNYVYYWKNENFQTIFTKKNECGNTIYLVYSKRGYTSNICSGKAKFNKEKGILIIYEKCINNKNNHSSIDINKKNDYKNIDMNIKNYQKYFLKCLYEENIVNTYIDCV